MVIDPRQLEADRVLDQAWRGGGGAARAVTHAHELREPLRCDPVMEDAKLIVSNHRSCSPDEALSRLVFVSQHTNRKLQDIAREVVASAAADQLELAEHPTPHMYRFTL